jgi:hypothetical protein
MILETLEWLATPCPRPLRDLGYLSELIAIGARHRRCRAAWADHLSRSRQAILDAADRAANRRRAIVLGSGRLLDVPLAGLAARFESVALVDAVHPLAARWQARRHANVTLVTRDVTGIIEALHRWRPGEPLPVPRPLDMIHEPDVDLVVSLNLLSQLGVLPIEWLEKRGGSAARPSAEALSRSLTRSHLDDLARCRAPVCLIGDVEWWRASPDGAVVERSSSIDGIEAPAALAEWIWAMAPAPEADRRLSEFRRVIVARDPGKSAQAG